MRILFFATLVCVASSFMQFQDRIPNGDKVPHPCKPNYVWQGVGHKNKAGGGARNPFGRDFDRNGKKWDECLCQRDSDGDGKTNGEEMGDPECKWKSLADNAQLRTTGLSHPGVCEPLEDTTCKVLNDFDVCGADTESVCDAVGDPDVTEFNVTLTLTPVPAKETTYICQVFDMPTDADYHVVGSRSVIDNKYVMHHILLFACDVSSSETELAKYNQPHECNMAASTCRTIVAGWTLGQEGPACWNSKDYGFPVGKGSFKKVMMQMHWNNPELNSDYTDSSGLTLYLTRRLKTYNMGMLTVGPRYLELPPGQPAVVQQGGCSAECTQNLASDIYLIKGSLHMHYLGKSGKTELYRDGKKVQDILNYPVYSYDNPITFDLNALRVKPGDELKVTCVYKTTSKTETVKFGDATSAEMCFSFLNYYPANYNFSACLSFEDLDICPKSGRSMPEYEQCNVRKFITESSPNLNTTKAVAGKCDMSGQTCRPGCQEAIAALKTHPCHQGTYGNLVEELSKLSSTGRLFVNALHSCDDKSDESDGKQPGSENDKEDTATAPPGVCVFTGLGENTSGAESVLMATVSIGTLICTIMLAPLRTW